MEQVLLVKAKVPAYLVGSDYFLSLNDDEEFTVPEKFLKLDPTVDSCEKLHHILETVRFWGARKLPRDIVQFLVDEKGSAEDAREITLVLSEFDAEIPLLQAFKYLQLPIMSKVKSEVISLLYCAFAGEGTLTTALVKIAAENGFDGLLHRIVDEAAKINGGPFTRISMKTIVSHGHTGSLRFLLKNKCRKEYDICAFAAEVGSLDCLKLFHEFGYQLEDRVINAAALFGHISCLQFAHTHGCKISEQTAINAAAGGSVDCVNYVFSHGAHTSDNILTAAARSGHTHLLPLLQENHCPITSDAVAAAASNGHLECIHYLISQGAKLTREATRAAAAGGQLECLEFLRAQDCPRGLNSVTAAASAGNLDCLEYLLRTGCPVDGTAATAATTNGHAHCLAALLRSVDQALVPVGCVDIAARMNKMDCLKLLFDAGVQLDLPALHEGFSRSNCKDYLRRLIEVGYHFPSSAGRYAISTQNIDCLKYLCEERKVDLSTDLCVTAARQVGELRYIELLRQYNCPWSESACAYAAACNNLACLTYLREQGCPWDATTYLAMLSRTTNPPLQCLHYALENGCPLGDKSSVRKIIRYMQVIAVPLTVVITNAAVERGSIDYVKNVLASGAPMDASTSAVAARFEPTSPSRSLKMLEYLHSQGCPWDERTSNAAAAHRTAACLRYVHEKGCPWTTTSIALTAASNGAAECLQYALSHGCSFDAAVLHAGAAQPSCESLQILHRAGCRWSVSVAYAAASAGSLACLQYAREHGCPWDATVSEAAVQHPECLHYCVKQGCPIIHSTMEEYNKNFPVRE